MYQWQICTHELTEGFGDHILIMRNSSFGGIHARLIEALGAASA